MEKPKQKKVPMFQVYKAATLSYDEAVIEERARFFFQRFIEEKEITSGRACYNWTKLHKSFTRYNSKYYSFLDHAGLFISAKKVNGETIETRYLVTHPYPQKSEDEILDWAKVRGLSCDIDKTTSWYFPGNTWRIVFTIEDEEKFKHYIEKSKKSRGSGMWEVT
jgi:hypothetical protein